MNRVQQKLLEEIVEHEEKLNDWERGFVDNLQRKDYTLTENQNKILNKIHHKAVFDD